MERTARKSHWENIYETKKLTEVSWYEPVPETSLTLIQELGLPNSAKIIDVGGGDSLLVDHLLELRYDDVTVLDVSEKAIHRAQSRLGDRADAVKWIVADASDFTPTEQYDLWHDRAAFHFLTEPTEVASYQRAVAVGVASGGHLVIGAFSDLGPKKCSGIEICQYSAPQMSAVFNEGFELVKSLQVDHRTPSGADQHFTFGVFEKNA